MPSSFRPTVTRADRVATLDDAKAHFQKSWDAWKAWAKLEDSRYDLVGPQTEAPAVKREAEEDWGRP